MTSTVLAVAQRCLLFLAIALTRDVIAGSIAGVIGSMIISLVFKFKGRP
jgi:uncharacterized membrane protein